MSGKISWRKSFIPKGRIQNSGVRIQKKRKRSQPYILASEFRILNSALPFSSCHQQSNLFGRGLLRINFAYNAAFVNYQQSVRKSRDLFKFCGDQKHCAARVTQRYEFTVNEFDCAYVNAARRL